MSPERPRHVRQLASELELLSHGKVANLNPSGTAASADQHGPTPDPDIWHLRFLAQYDRALGPVSREVVVERWRTELRTLRGHGIERAAGESIEDTDRRMVREGIGWTVDEVARHFRCTPTRIRRACTANCVLVVDGRLVASGVAEGVGRAEHALALEGDGLTQAEIADRMGISQPTVHRLLKAAKFRRFAA